MILVLTPENPVVGLKVNLIASNDDKRLKGEDSIYLTMAPFFIGPKGDTGEKGDTNNENIFSHVDW